MRIMIDNATVECVVGDITKQSDIMAIVNAANAELMPGGGVAGAIHRAAGPDLVAACRPLAPIKPGEAVITDAFGLPNEKIIHCLGPVYGVDSPEADLLAACYRTAIALADREGMSSVAFPAISTGAFGYPIEAAAAVACASCVQALRQVSAVRLVRHVLFDRNAANIFAREMERAAGQTEDG